MKRGKVKLLMIYEIKAKKEHVRIIMKRIFNGIYFNQTGKSLFY